MGPAGRSTSEGERRKGEAIARSQEWHHFLVGEAQPCVFALRYTQNAPISMCVCAYMYHMSPAILHDLLSFSSSHVGRLRQKGIRSPRIGSGLEVVGRPIWPAAKK